MMQVWAVLGGIMFFAQCAMRSEPYLKVIMGKQAHESASHSAPARPPSR